ncbi:GGDEF domain-containing protein [Neobacillus mesonae]|uniref:GGDEF domain-containing protein n=1 Tax=Neobacillus mesonae TaxID=1193713 RepID=UPI00203AF982|nr:GGDEF domain-containing protein [Neobacillus mesonae]MCM3570449.1 GGDEF domain-containing protein [Neobacillus mesonae]
MTVKRKYFLWFFIIVSTLFPILIDLSLPENYDRFSTFIWSFFLVPNILFLVLYPKWKYIIGSAAIFSFFKYVVEFSQGTPATSIESMMLISESVVNGAILFTVGYFRIRYNKVLGELRKMTTMDSLTGLYNRRYFDFYMEKIIPLSQRQQSPLTLIMVDIDHFKLVNDNYGHQCGDEALKHVAEVIKNNVRNSDAYVRFGGEEFALILPNTDLNEAVQIAERLRESVEQSDFVYNRRPIHITISMGMTLYRGEKLEEFIEKADQALYRAKENGRNRVISFAS